MKIADNFGDDEAAAQRARQKLAAILLALPIGDERDPGYWPTSRCYLKQWPLSQREIDEQI